MAAKFCLAVILSADKALRDLDTFDFVALQLFSAGGHHSFDVAELLRLIERLEELHTKVQGIISSPHLSTTLLFDVSRRCSQYLKRCVAASASDVVKVPGGSVPFYLKPILVDLEGGRYIDQILPDSLVDIIAGRRPEGGDSPKSNDGGGGGSGTKKTLPKVAATGGSAQVKADYDVHLPYL